MTAPADDRAWLLGLEEPDYDSDPPDLPPEEADALDLANYHLRMIHAVRHRRGELAANFDAEVVRLKMRLESRLGVLERQEAWHTRPVVNLHAALLARDDKRKTVTLACGTLKARAQQPEWDFHDEVAFLAWAQDHAPALVRQPAPPPPAIDKAAAKAALVVKDEKGKVLRYGVEPASMEVPPGLVVNERGPKFELVTDDET